MTKRNHFVFGEPTSRPKVAGRYLVLSPDRCQKAKIQCDGYASLKTWLFEARDYSSKDENQQLQLKTDDGEDNEKSVGFYPAPVEPASIESWPYCSFGSPREQAAFQWYIDKTASLASSWAAAAFWRQILPQSGHTSNPLKHAVLALSYTDYAISGDQQTAALTDNTRGLRSYCRAVSLINSSPHSDSSQWLETLLIASVAFWTFDLRNRRPQLASMHFHATTRLLKQISEKKSDQKTQLAKDVEEMLHGFSATQLPDRVPGKTEHDTKSNTIGDGTEPCFASHDEARASLARILWAIALARSTEPSRRRMSPQALEQIVFEEATESLIDYSRLPFATFAQCRMLLEAWTQRVSNMYHSLPPFEERVLLAHAELATVGVLNRMGKAFKHPLKVAEQQKDEEAVYSRMLSTVRQLVSEKKFAEPTEASVTGLQPLIGHILLTSRKSATHTRAFSLLWDVVALERGQNIVNVIWMGFICY